MPSLGIIGWILVILGVVSFLWGVACSLLATLKGRPEVKQVLVNLAGDVRAVTSKGGSDVDKLLEAIAKACEALGKVLEEFGKLAVGVQWAVLGLVSIGVGAYLLKM